MGALGSIVASRVAREFRLGGPSFTVSSEETSGFRALDVAVGMLGRGELDRAIVGAVDLPGELRASIAESRLHPSRMTGDGAAVLVLKRLVDAEKDGDKVYAVIRGIGRATGQDASRASANRALMTSAVEPSRVGYLDSSIDLEGSSEVAVRASVEGDVGHAGAASGLASVVKAALCLHQQVLPTLRDGGSGRVSPRGVQSWLRDRAEGPRVALVGGSGVDGNAAHVVLESHEAAADRGSPDRAPTARPPAFGPVRGRGR